MDPVKEAIFARLAILARHEAQGRRDTLVSDGLQHWQFKMPQMLRRLGPPYAASPWQLADTFAPTRGALSARLGPLEDPGLITRTHDAADRRRVEVRLTEAGYDAFERTRCRRTRVRKRCSQRSPQQRGGPCPTCCGNGSWQPRTVRPRTVRPRPAHGRTRREGPVQT